VCGDISGIAREIVFDRVFGLDACEFAHGDYYGHDLPGKFAGGGKAEGLV
jgi:hypothetical protein